LEDFEGCSWVTDSVHFKTCDRSQVSRRCP